MKNKLKSQKGESLAEVLVASLVILMAFLLMHSAVVSSSRMVKQADEKYARSVAEENRLNRRDEACKDAQAGKMILEMKGKKTEIALDVYSGTEKKNGRQGENVVFGYRKKEK